jgi:hypothetical protein
MWRALLARNEQTTFRVRVRVRAAADGGSSRRGRGGGRGGGGRTAAGTWQRRSHGGEVAAASGGGELAAGVCAGPPWLRLVDLRCEMHLVASTADVGRAVAALRPELHAAAAAEEEALTTSSDGTTTGTGLPLLGLDTESVPIVTKGAKSTPVALLQLASAHHAFLLDLPALARVRG